MFLSVNGTAQSYGAVAGGGTMWDLRSSEW